MVDNVSFSWCRRELSFVTLPVVQKKADRRRALPWAGPAGQADGPLGLFVFYTLVYTLRKQYLWKGMTQERVNLAWQEKQDKGRALAVWPPWGVLSAAHSQWGATTGHATSWGKLCHLDISPVDTILGKWFIKNTRNYTSYLLFRFSDGKIISHLIVSSRPPTGTWGLVYRG